MKYITILAILLLVSCNNEETKKEVSVTDAQNTQSALITNKALQLANQVSGVYTAKADVNYLLGFSENNLPVRIHMNHSKKDDSSNVIFVVERIEQKGNEDNFFCTLFMDVETYAPYKGYGMKIIGKTRSTGSIREANAIHQFTVLSVPEGNSQMHLWFNAPKHMVKKLTKTKDNVSSYDDLFNGCGFFVSKF